jgi:hypothetical protein
MFSFSSLFLASQLLLSSGAGKETTPDNSSSVETEKEGNVMEEKRRFSRIRFIEKSFIEMDNRMVEVRLLDISLKGALIEFISDVALQKGDIRELTFHLGDSEIILQFKTEAVHCRGNKAGLKFIGMDLDTMIHLRSLIEARILDPEKVQHELGFLLENN